MRKILLSVLAAGAMLACAIAPPVFAATDAIKVTAMQEAPPAPGMVADVDRHDQATMQIRAQLDAIEPMAMVEQPKASAPRSLVPGAAPLSKVSTIDRCHLRI